MPILPPRLRIKLKIPLALPIFSLESVPTEMAMRGTMTHPTPNPCKTLGQTMLPIETSSVRFPNSNVAAAVQATPNDISHVVPIHSEVNRLGHSD